MFSETFASAFFQSIKDFLLITFLPGQCHILAGFCTSRT